MKEWLLNPGHCPESVKGKRIRVQLRNGIVARSTWKAETTRWSLTDHPFDVVRYRIED